MSEGIVIRVAMPDDANKVEDLLGASYPALMRESYDAAVLSPALALMTRANPKLLGSRSYYLAENENGSAIGCGGWTVQRPGTGEILPRLAHIRHFGTHPEWVGRGIGRAIYGKCEEMARLANMNRFECYSSLNAEGFYASLGFKRVRRMEIEMGPKLKIATILMDCAI